MLVDEQTGNVLFRSEQIRREFMLSPRGAYVYLILLSLNLADDMRLVITSVERDSPSHRNLHAVDAGFTFASALHPKDVGLSLRLTDRTLLQSKLISLYDRVRGDLDPFSVYVENDHLHIDDVVRPEGYGVFLYDNPRHEYHGESELISNPELARYYPRPLRSRIKIFPK
jgi:hypothetical protein